MYYGLIKMFLWDPKSLHGKNGIQVWLSFYFSETADHIYIREYTELVGMAFVCFFKYII